MLSEKRDEPAARALFEKAIGYNGLPEKVTMNKSGANKAGIDTINLQLALLFMKGFKAFHDAEAPLTGIELHHMLRKESHSQSDNQTIFEQYYGVAV
jgi:putative transposase